MLRPVETSSRSRARFAVTSPTRRWLTASSRDSARPADRRAPRCRLLERGEAASSALMRKTPMRTGCGTCRGRHEASNCVPCFVHGTHGDAGSTPAVNLSRFGDGGFLREGDVWKQQRGQRDHHQDRMARHPWSSPFGSVRRFLLPTSYFSLLTSHFRLLPETISVSYSFPDGALHCSSTFCRRMSTRSVHGRCRPSHRQCRE